MHAECPVSRYENTERAWAKFLFDEVFLDGCGFPIFLHSGRGAEFTCNVMQELKWLLNITHRLGSAYHPQAQGHVEARHKPSQAVLRVYAASLLEDWATFVNVAQWALRCVPRGDRAGRSPHRIVTGLRPQGSGQHLFEKVLARLRANARN